MKQLGFLDDESRSDLIQLALDRLAANRWPRRANTLVVLDACKSVAEVAECLLLDEDMIRRWPLLYEENGIDSRVSLGCAGCACRLDSEQQNQVNRLDYLGSPAPDERNRHLARGRIWFEYHTRSGLVALLHRLRMEHRKLTSITYKLDLDKQVAFIKACESLLNQIADDEAVLFGVPAHSVGSVGSWSPTDVPVAMDQRSGHDRLNIHGATELKTGRTAMNNVLTVDAASASTIMLLMAAEAMYPGKRLVHIFLDNAKSVRSWLAPSDCRIKPHFVPAYWPHLNPIERLWDLMHRYTTHYKWHANSRDFRVAMFDFLRRDMPKKLERLVWCRHG